MKTGEGEHLKEESRQFVYPCLADLVVTSSLVVTSIMRQPDIR